MTGLLSAVGGIASLASSALSATKPAPKKELTQQDFLMLLTKQLTAQDPMKPYDSSSMLQQMANLTSLNASDSLKKAISSLQTSLGNTQLVQASSIVGKQVQVPSQTSSLTAEGLAGAVSLTVPASDVVISIQDAAGKTVKNIPMGNLTAGTFDFKWDGKGADGQPLPQGSYKISALGSINGQNTALSTLGSFLVQAVNLNSQTNSVQLNLGTKGNVDISEIARIA